MPRAISGDVQSHRWRAFYFDYIEDDAQAENEWRAMKEHEIAYLVLGLFRLERFQEALDLCDERKSRFPGARFTDFFRGFVLSAVTDSPQEVVAAFAPPGKESLDAHIAHRFNFVIHCLAGDVETAQSASRRLRAPYLEDSADEYWSRKMVAYTCGELGEDQLLAMLADTRTGLCQAHFLIGLTQLARGDRQAARKHFHAATELKVVTYLEHPMSRALVVQLDREPDWPRWVTLR